MSKIKGMRVCVRTDRRMRAHFFFLWLRTVLDLLLSPPFLHHLSLPVSFYNNYSHLC